VERSVKESWAARTVRRLVCIAVSIAVVACLIPGRPQAEAVRRLSVGIVPAFYIFDDSYWGAKSGYGTDLVLRCEIVNNLFIENRLGGYGGSQGDARLTGFDGEIGIIHFLPYLIPYRPSFRAGFAFMTVNPVVSEPVESFRPSQTIIYFVTGIGITWSLKEYLQLELGVDLLVTPYRYRIYHFYRQYVETSEVHFLHGAFTIGASYSF